MEAKFRIGEKERETTQSEIKVMDNAGYYKNMKTIIEIWMNGYTMYGMVRNL